MHTCVYMYCVIVTVIVTVIVIVIVILVVLLFFMCIYLDTSESCRAVRLQATLAGRGSACILSLSSISIRSLLESILWIVPRPQQSAI